MITKEQIRSLLEDRVGYSIEIEEDDTAVRGNCIASGDDALDKEVEDKIIERLKDGDLWAWCTVTVTAKFSDRFVIGVATLGACCYKDEEDYKAGGYYEQMKDEALDDLIDTFMGHVTLLEVLGLEVTCDALDPTDDVATTSG